MNPATTTIADYKILKRNEIAAILNELRRLSSRSVNTKQNQVVFRLSTCCGLRASELCGLHLRDVRCDLEKPYLRVPKLVAKGHKYRVINGERHKVGSTALARTIPLHWDAATLADIESWKRLRERQGAKPQDHFLCSQAAHAFGRPLTRQNARARFIRTCRILGKERASELTIHSGRHSFVSHALNGGRTLAEVQRAVGHASLSTTSVYLHVVVDDNDDIGDLFDYGSNGENQ